MQLKTCKWNSKVTTKSNSAKRCCSLANIFTNQTLQLLLSTSNPCIQEGFDDHLGVYRHCLYSGCSDETDYLLRLRDNICYYAQIIDTYAPCIVGSSKWNNDVNMDFHCATTNKKVWNRKILSISDETFILLCLINYGKRWFAEFVKADKLVSKTCKLFARTSQAAASNN